MRPSFNIAGPCLPGEHYMVPPERRLGPALEIIEEGKYFTLTAGRQTGKTTSLFWLVDHLRAGERFSGVWIDLQGAREQPEPEKAMRTVLEKIDRAVARDLPDLARPPAAQIAAWLQNPGERTRGDALDDDFAYVIGLGLLRRNLNGTYEIANPIYREVIPGALTYVDQGQIQIETAPFVRADGSLDMPKLMAAWQDFWRKDGHLSAEGLHYRESGPHLMLMAFLQRIINGGGRVEPEYALGRGALDLLIEWKGARHAVEVKVRRDTQTEERALEQVARYLTSLGLTEGWLVLFDLRSSQPWPERLWNRDVEHAGKRIHLVGC